MISDFKALSADKVFRQNGYSIYLDFKDFAFGRFLKAGIQFGCGWYLNL